MKKKNILSTVFLVFFALIFAVSATFLVKELVERRQGVRYVETLQSEYIPEIPEEIPEDTVTEQPDEEVVSANRINTANPTIEKLTADYPEVVGWLTVEGANVSHPFVLTDDNSSYLWNDLDGNYIRGGTLFMDYRCTADLSDNVTVIYGHNMKDGTMFGSLDKFLDYDYLLENQDVYISLPDCTLRYTVAACLVVDAANSIIFDNISATGDIQNVEDYICRNAQVNPATELTGESRLLVLSTCHGAYETARTLLICIPY